MTTTQQPPTDVGAYVGVVLRDRAHLANQNDRLREQLAHERERQTTATRRLTTVMRIEILRSYLNAR